MLGRPDDVNPLLSAKELGHSEYPNKCNRNPTIQYPASGGVSRTQDKKPRHAANTQVGTGEKEKIKISEGYRRLFTKPRISVAGYSAFHQTTQLPQLFWFHREQTRYLKYFYLPFFFRTRPQPPERKTRRGGQCRRGVQKPDINTLSESLRSRHALGTGGTLYGIHCALLLLVRQSDTLQHCFPTSFNLA
ncbi:uncharacterized protein LOC143787981 isoform X2 [Ranitomeya variabilis]|uniref:uncharacterized protein LOC143787981 isoform X2 n=1 Tax=Ranitomeya variabilis TaxID=490064 RepID=UPI0040563C85